MTEAVMTSPSFEGTADEQALAERVFDVMTRAYGSLYGRDALIRQSLDNLATFLAEQDGASADALRPRIERMLKKNPNVFQSEDRDGNILVSTTRRGLSVGRPLDTKHTFRTRLYEPATPLPVDDMSNIVTTIRQPIPVAEPLLISPYWRGQHETAPEPTEAPEAKPQPVAAAPVEEVSAAPVEEAVAAPVRQQQPEPSAPSTSIVLSDGAAVDLALPLEQLLAEHGFEIQAEIRRALEDDPLRRVVSFGEMYYPADALPTFGKNDLRRIRDFIVEQGEPVLDTTVLTDLYRERPSNNNFEIVRFALDYRLAREKDFEFVGMPGANLWSAKGLPAIGGKRVKASDLGQLLSYLVEGYEDTDQEATPELVMHPLSFFEWEYGVLPLTEALAAVMPVPLLDDQRSAVVRIEYRNPQQYNTFLCEVRYASGNRGGWVWGFADFFREYLVPGVMISIAPTEEPNVFTIAYDEASGTEAQLLHRDEKRNKFVYVPVTYYAQVDEALLPSQSRYNKLRNLKALPMNDRKKADLVLTHVFETVGEQLGSKEEPLYWVTFDELLLSVNVLRPISSTYLHHLLG
ncbi:MAG: FIG00502883: hypothetical protein, partial [uncultured Chloroflexia bacterium]